MKRHSLNPISILVRSLFAAAMPLYAFDPNDAADKAAVQKLIDEAVAPLKEKRDELLGEVKRLKKGVEVKPEDVEKLEAENEALKTQLGEAQKALKTASKTAEDTTNALKGEQSFTQKLLIENGLNAALSAAGVSNPIQLKAAAALIRANSKIEVVADGENRAAKVGDKDLAAFVKEWSQGDEGKHFVSAQQNSGGGAPGNTGTQHKGAGNLGGSKDERNAAIASRFPELNS